jgi:murein L,D-transpeptidase YafK
MGNDTKFMPLTRRAALSGAGAAGMLALGALPARAFVPRAAVPVDLVVVVKRRRLLQLLYRDRVMRTYRVALGSNPVGHKRERGDGRTPEGLYRIDYKKPESKFNLALHVDYPNARDRALAAARGVDPGGAIYIHGHPKEASELAYFRMKFSREDWTDGCIALPDPQMSEIYRSVLEGTPILIRP